jgi:hypothetical protein
VSRRVPFTSYSELPSGTPRSEYNWPPVELVRPFAVGVTEPTTLQAEVLRLVNVSE